MNIRIPLSYLFDLFGQLQLISLVFVKCVLLVSSFIFFLKGERSWTPTEYIRFFFYPQMFYIFPIFFIYSLWISFPFKYIKINYKKLANGGKNVDLMV